MKWVAIAAGGGSPLLGQGGQHLGDEVITEEKATVTHEDFGDTRIFFKGPTSQLKSMTAGSLLLKPGMQPHPPHQHAEEEIMVVTSGNGEILVGGKQVKAGPGSMMFCEANRLHGIRNTGSEPLLFYFYKWLA
ncbi:MAG: cupin domain-containing protein [Bryobacteraceae bacterium]